MTTDQLVGAIVKAFLQGGEDFVAGTLAAALPVFWLLALALHLARPYVLGMTRKFSLRVAADIWWVLYIALRDGLLVLTFAMSFMYLYPDVLVAAALPIGGSLATAALFGVLLTKLVADADDDPRAFRIASSLLAIGATLYILPLLIGVQASVLPLGEPPGPFARAFTTSTNQGLAIPLCWASIVAIGAMGMVAVWFNVRSPGATPGGATP